MYFEGILIPLDLDGERVIFVPNSEPTHQNHSHIFSPEQIYRFLEHVSSNLTA